MICFRTFLIFTLSDILFSKDYFIVQHFPEKMLKGALIVRDIAAQ